MEDSSVSHVTKLCCSSILDAAQEGHANCIRQHIGRRLRSRTSEILEAVNVHSVPDRTSPLQLSARRGHVECVDLLIDAGADINWQDSEERTALHHAASGEAEDERAASCARSLIAAGANVSVKTDREETALHLAASNLSVEVMKVLLSAKRDVDEDRLLGCTALHLVVDSSEQTKKKQECMQLLLAHGASVSPRNSRNWTPLTSACRAVNYEFDGSQDCENMIAPVRILLEAGAVDVGLSSSYEVFTQLCWNMSQLCNVYDSNSDYYDRGVKVYMGFLELLIEHGVPLETINDQEEHYLIRYMSDAVIFAPTDFLRCLLRVRGFEPWMTSTMLERAVYAVLDGPKKLRILLDAGACVCNAGFYGRLALFACAKLLPSDTPQFHNSVEMFNILVSNGARPCTDPERCVLDHQDESMCLCGQIMLHTAVKNGNVALVDVILKTGIDASVPCDHMTDSPSHYPLITALNVSQAHGPSLVQLLLSYGADPGIVLQPAIKSSTLSFVQELCPRSINIRAISSVLALLPIIPLRCQKHQSVECCETLLTHISSPPSLQECCRATICSSLCVNRLLRQGLREAVRSLPIPNIMKDFLLVPFGLSVNSPGL